MESKFELQFEDNEYYLVDVNTNDTVATTDKVLLKEYDGHMKKLSLKNCEAVANGYDLEEISSSLRKEFEIKYNTSKGIPLRGGGYIIRGLDYQVGVIDGFQKALEILGDKKYTETELYHAFLINSAGNDTTLRNFFEQTVLPMIQQTEWDVEIEMECGEVKQCECSSNNNCLNSQPKLDAAGCLILKRK